MGEGSGGLEKKVGSLGRKMRFFWEKTGVSVREMGVWGEKMRFLGQKWRGGRNGEKPVK